MSDSSKISCPRDFKAFPDRNILKIPKDNQVFSLCGNHGNPFHSLYVMQILCDAAQNGYTLAAEIPTHQRKAYEESLKLGYRPRYFEKEYPVLADMCSAAADYKVLRTASFLKMPIMYVDDPNKESYDAESLSGIDRRNILMVKDFPEQLSQGKKILFWGGPYHLYSGDGCTGIPELLYQSNIKTFSVSLLTDREDILKDNDQKNIEHIDKNAARKIAKVFRKNLSALQEKRPVSFNLHDFTEHAGKKCPDQLILFSEASARWWDGEMDKSGFDEDVEAEAGVLNAIWQAHILPEKKRQKESALRLRRA